MVSAADGGWIEVVVLEVELKRAFFVYHSKAPSKPGVRRIRSLGLRQGETSEVGGTCFSGRENGKPASGVSSREREWSTSQAQVDTKGYP